MFETILSLSFNAFTNNQTILKLHFYLLTITTTTHYFEGTVLSYNDTIVNSDFNTTS